MTTINPRLTDLQLVLLSAAIQREDGSVLPVPDTLSQPRATLNRAINALIRAGLVAEVELRPGSRRGEYRLWRQEADQRFGVFITDMGRAAIGATEEPVTASAAQPEASKADEDPEVVRPGSGAAPSSSSPPPNKTALVLTLLRRKGGATLGDLTAATGWLPHTTRAALTGLRKKGHTIVREKHDDISIYRIAG